MGVLQGFHKERGIKEHMKRLFAALESAFLVLSIFFCKFSLID
jgi:preprotein translocase subunit SecG